VIATTEARRIMRILSGHDAISAAITIYLSLAVIGQTTHGAIATTVPATINVIAMHGHLYSALEAGGEAYICTVGTRTPNGLRAGHRTIDDPKGNRWPAHQRPNP
jgi:hypothetical protein